MKQKNTLLLLLMSCFSLSLMSIIEAQSILCLPSQLDALLAFKTILLNSRKELSSWSTSRSCCSWKGISCNSAGFVTHFLLTSRRLQLNTSTDPLFFGSHLAKLTELEVLSITGLAISNYSSPPQLPARLASLQKLTTLSLVDNQFSGPIPVEWSSLASLQNLNLSLNSRLNGDIPRSLCNLSNLQTFSVANTLLFPGGLQGPIPSCFGLLRKLTHIELSNNAIIGSIPSSIGNLINLVSLRLSNNMLQGPIPSSIGNLTQLQFLTLEGNSLSGNIPTSLGTMDSLRELRLGAGEDSSGNIQTLDRDLMGSIPSGIGGKALRILRIRGTSVFGSIPGSLGSISSALREIVLDNNALTGSIPASLGNLKKLVTLDLSSNHIVGVIPASLGRPKKNLNFLSIAHNHLSGIIPSSLSSLSLSNLDLSDNHLTGSIPSDIGQALRFGKINLANNLLTGGFPPSLWNLTSVTLSNNRLTSLPTGHLPADVNSHLQKVFVDSNQLSGQIPPWIFDVPAIFFVNLANNKFVSPLPSIDINLLSVSSVNFSRNLLSGTIPDEWANLRGLNTLDFSFNQFSGKIPSNFSSGSGFLNNLLLSHNMLSGPLPDQIFASGFFQSLDLSYNQLTGPIPNLFPDTSSFLSSVDLSFNKLSGSIPGKLFTFSLFLEKVKLDHNQFVGEIPDLAGACQPGGNNLNFLALNDNNFTGVLAGASWIPICAGKFTVFDISGNGFTGQIPDFSSWTSLKVLNLAGNKFTGQIPSFLFTDLPSLRVLDLSRNELNGPIPANLSGLVDMTNSTGADFESVEGGPFYQDALFFTGADFLVSFTLSVSTTTAIDLSHNTLSGLLPTSIGSVSGLHVLDVANNNLSGALPASLNHIEGLKIFDVAKNAFSGRIPTSLQGFPASDFAGNAGLCGLPLAVKCP